MPEARWYLNWPAKSKNDKGVIFNTFNTSHKNEPFAGLNQQYKTN